MYKKFLITSLLALVTSFGYTQSEKINIKSEHLKEVNYLKIHDFYLTHYLYIDVFLRENLFPEATPEDVSAIFKAVKKYVSIENRLDVEIEKPGDRNYLIKFAILKKDDGTELLIAFTNWSPQKREFEKEIKMENDSYTRWYFLNRNKMIYRKDMSDQNDYASMNKSDLANAYLFDELPENDAKIKIAIDAALKEKDINLSDEIMGNLILLKYLIFQRDTDNIEKQTKHLNSLFEIGALESNLKGLEVAFNATKFQIALMK